MHPLVEYQSAFERKVYSYLKRIDQIDGILAKSLPSLIDFAANEPNLDLPVWVAEDVESEKTDNVFTRALCSATLQRASAQRRRFPWLKKRVDQKALWKPFVVDDPSALALHADIL